MKVVLFDGVCNLCNSSVDFILKHDKENVFKFASQQSEVGKRLLPQFSSEKLNNPGTIVLIDEEKAYTKSSAVFRIFSYLKGYPKWVSYLQIFPKSLTDFVYEIIAKNRYSWFGKKETCRLPTPEEQEKFL